MGKFVSYPKQKTYYVYKHLSKKGEIIYVGLTCNLKIRTYNHASVSRWFSKVSKIQIERYPNHFQALQAERFLIREHSPKYNKVHNTGHPKELKRLKSWRRKRGISAQEMSEDMGQDKNYISRIEDKSYIPTVEEVFDIIRFSNHSLNFLDFIY